MISGDLDYLVSGDKRESVFKEGGRNKGSWRFAAWIKSKTWRAPSGTRTGDTKIWISEKKKCGNIAERYKAGVTLSGM
jgi:hypothetical protein